MRNYIIRFIALAITLNLFIFVSQPQLAHAKKYGGTFIKVAPAEPPTMSGEIGNGVAAFMVATNIYNLLVRYDYDFKTNPELAESWEISNDGKTYTFKLRNDVKWHDGVKFTSADVKFSLLEITCKHHNRGKSWCPSIKSIETAGDYTVIINLTRAFAPLLTILSDYNTGTLIRPKHIYEKGYDKNNPFVMSPKVGTGPFIFSKWVKGSHVELVRNKNYWKKGLPYLDRLVVQFLPDEAGRLAAFENGDLDMIHSYILPYEHVKRFKKDPRFQVIEHGNEATATNANLLLNHDNQYLKHKKVRQAIAMALDKDKITDAAMFGASKAAHAHIGSGVSWIHFPEYDYKQNIAKSNAMLDAAGFERGSDGTRFSLRDYWSSGRAFEGRAAQVIRSQLRKVGIDIKISSFDKPSFVEKVFKKRDFDLAHQLFTTSPDPTLSVVHRYHSKNIGRPYANAAGWVNKEYDELTTAEVGIVSTAARAAVWRRICQILMDELPGYPLHEMPNMQLVRAGFNDVIMDPAGYYGIHERTYVSN